MKEHYDQLCSLINSLPSFNSTSSYSQLNSVLNKYTATLNYVNSYSEEYKSSTNVYYSEISIIRDNIQDSLDAASESKKNVAFDRARNCLQREIKALANLIKPQEKFAEVEA